MDDTVSRRIAEIRHELGHDEESAFRLFQDAFQAPWDRGDYRQCHDLLVAARELPFRGRAYRQWFAYYDGCLANEYERSWDRSERVFSELLQEELPPPLRGKTLMALAFACEYQARWRPAVDLLQQAVVVFEGLADPLSTARALNNLGIIYTRGCMFGEFSSDQLLQAEACLQRAVAIAGPKHPRLSSQAWLNLGAVYKELGRWRQALDCYRRHMTICRRKGFRRSIALGANNRGEVYHRLGWWRRAESSFRQAVAILHECGDRYEEADALANLASLYGQRRRASQALATYDRAIQTIESLRLSVTSAEARIGFFETAAHVYGGRILLSLEQGQVQEAFDHVERAKSRAFVEMLGSRAPGRPRQVPAGLLAEEQDLRARLRTLYQAPAAPEAEIARLEARLAALGLEMHRVDAEYASFSVVAPLAHHDVQQRLPADAVLLEYYLTSERIVAFALTRDAVQARPLALSPAGLQRAFDSAHRLKRLFPDPQGQLHEPWVLERLYDHLIAPVHAWIGGARRLYLVPHGVLHYVPFHALCYRGRDGGKRYLLQDHAEIVYAPSATVLFGYCQDKPRSRQRSCLVLGYGRDLQHAEAEARTVAAVTGGQLYLGDQASRDVVFGQADRYRFLHFSTHGLFNPRWPLSSGLVLADGVLEAWHVLEHLRLDADLVTLSACETGLSKVTRGDELIGLPRAFIFAGTPSVVVSLWRVDQLSTRLFMEQFYSELLSTPGSGGPLRTAEALRRAQLRIMNLSDEELAARLRAHGDRPQSISRRIRAIARRYGHGTGEPIFSHPYFWAPFLLVGDRV